MMYEDADREEATSGEEAFALIASFLLVAGLLATMYLMLIRHSEKQLELEPRGRLEEVEI